MKDPQGVIPGVTVTLTNEQNNTTRETVTNGVGEYSFPAVDPARYTVKASVPGYKTFERKGITISVQSFVGLDITLEVGALEETISVTGDVLDTKTLETIPTAGRSVFLMANLQPTVQTSGNAHWNRMQDQVGNSAVSMGGGAVRAALFGSPAGKSKVESLKSKVSRSRVGSRKCEVARRDIRGDFRLGLPTWTFYFDLRLDSDFRL